MTASVREDPLRAPRAVPAGRAPMPVRLDTAPVEGLLEAQWDGDGLVRWAIWDPGLPGADGVFVLHDGDCLRVEDDSGTVLWQGVVALDRTVRTVRVQGVQADFAPEFWAQLFLGRARARADLPVAANRVDRPIAEHLRAVADGALPPQADSTAWVDLPEWPHRQNRRAVACTVGFAADELGLSPAEVAATLGVPAAALRSWRPFDEPGPELEGALPRIALLQRVLKGTFLRWRWPRAAERRAWMRAAAAGLPAPAALMTSGLDGLRAACALADTLWRR